MSKASFTTHRLVIYLCVVYFSYVHMLLFTLSPYVSLLPVYSSVFDFESVSVYDSLHLYAVDDGRGEGQQGLPSVPSTVIINIVNLNDNPPRFSRDLFSE